MLKKIDLREVREPEQKIFKREGIFVYSHTWEVWGEEEDTGNKPESLTFTKSSNDFANNILIVKGSLKDCIEVLSYVILMELHTELMRDKRHGGTRQKNPVQEQTKCIRAKQAEIRKACWENGEYRGDSWFIRSTLTREECQWKSQNFTTYVHFQKTN